MGVGIEWTHNPLVVVMAVHQRERDQRRDSGLHRRRDDDHPQEGQCELR